MRENYFVAIFSFLFLGCRVRLHTRSDDGCASSCGELFMKAGWHREIILFREDLKDSKDNSNNNQQPPASVVHTTPSLLSRQQGWAPLAALSPDDAWHCTVTATSSPHRCYADLGGSCSGPGTHPLSRLVRPSTPILAPHLSLSSGSGPSVTEPGSGWLLSE